MKNVLWDQVNQWQKEMKWVDLTREMSPETAHWSGFKPMEVETIFTLADGFYVNKYTTVSQYGTHIDAPIHFIEGGRYLNEIEPIEMVCPLCVIDKSDKVKDNVDYALTVDDIKEWEAEHGQIPENAFVAFKSDWSKRPDSELDNVDADGNKHYPGWSVAAVDFLVEERNIRAIGHETSDTDPTVVAASEGFLAEIAILKHDRYQVELMINLSEVPPTGGIIFVMAPKVKDGPGFPVRCIAVCPK